MKNYSIIIPHHNIPDLLNRLLKTIPQKEDLEVIVVDDNSDINKKANINSSRKDVKVILLDPESSKGAGKARNVGIEHATGKWLIFADSDDFFEDGFYDVISHYVDAVEDIIYFCSESVDNDTLSSVDSRTDYANKMIKDGDLNNLRYHHYVPWSKMVRRELVIDNDIRFEEVPVCNDVIFSILIGLKAKTVLAVNEPIYVSTVRVGSLYYTSTKKRARMRLSAKLRANNILIRNNLDKYKPNLLREAKKGKQYSNLTFLHWILLAIKEEGLYWFLVDIWNVIKYKYSKRVVNE